MNEILPDLYHWQAHNPDIDHDVDCYYVALDSPVVIDPLEPAEGMD